MRTTDFFYPIAFSVLFMPLSFKWKNKTKKNNVRYEVDVNVTANLALVGLKIFDFLSNSRSTHKKDEIFTQSTYYTLHTIKST